MYKVKRTFFYTFTPPKTSSLFRFKKANNGTDNELIELYKNTGEKVYVGELYKRYAHLVFGVCLKYLKDPDESKDAVMAVFEKLMSDLNKYKIENFKSWLHTTAKNHCLMHLRSSKANRMVRNDEIKDSDFVMESGYELHHTSEIEKEATLNKLELAVKELKEGQRVCIELFYMQQKCYQEVSEITGFSMNEVKSFIQNGKRNLKIMLENSNE